MDLFESATVDAQGLPKWRPDAPLAVRMRPRTLEEYVGQSHLLQPNAPLRALLTSQRRGPSSVILWGPPGTGKTTLAYLVAQSGGRRFVEISAVSAGVKDIRNVVDQAKRELVASGVETVLFVDEVHRFSKSQQDSLLPAVENRWVILLAATTENPSFSVISPLLSRSLMLTLQPLDAAALGQLLDRALSDERGLAGKFSLGEGAREDLLRLAGSDGRKLLTLLEAAAGGCTQRGESEISVADISQAADAALVRYGLDQHYDVASAFIKSMRGSDPDAALHYLARMLAAGEDPRFIARRVIICASEDVGLAAPEILGITVAAAQAVALVGMPEARIILAQAVVAVATAPKSNRVYNGINQALADVAAGKSGVVPIYLRDQHYPGAKQDRQQAAYFYPHDDPRGVVPQEYLPESLAGVRYYEPSRHGYEAQIAARLEKVRKIQKMR